MFLFLCLFFFFCWFCFVCFFFVFFCFFVLLGSDFLTNCWLDRGTNFVDTQSYLNKTLQGWDIPKLQNVLSEEFSCSFHWEWKIPQASHQNRVIESLIKSGRQALDASSKNHTFTEEQGRMYLAEMTYLINGCPLCPSSV